VASTTDVAAEIRVSDNPARAEFRPALSLT